MEHILRKAVWERRQRDNLTLTEIGRRAGIAQPVLHQFMKGASITLRTAAKLCAYLGLELRPGQPVENEQPAPQVRGSS
jgi:transcriptional regulator with XRE-family HTH domain